MEVGLSSRAVDATWARLAPRHATGTSLQARASLGQEGVYQSSFERIIAGSTSIPPVELTIEPTLVTNSIPLLLAPKCSKKTMTYVMDLRETITERKSGPQWPYERSIPRTTGFKSSGQGFTVYLRAASIWLSLVAIDTGEAENQREPANG